MNFETEFSRSAESYNLLRGLGSQCSSEREHCFKTVTRNIDSWFLGFGSPNLNFMDNSIDSYSSYNNSLHYLIEQILPDLLRLSVTSPYDDVRENCHGLLISLQRKSFRIPKPKFNGPSNFIPQNEIESFSWDSEHLATLLNDHLEEWGRIENYISVMGYHPNYLEQYMKVYNHLFRGDGSLPYVDRYYLAIMAASQMHCKELIFRFITEYLASGGDLTWLNGIRKAPSRLKALSVLNQYLCHRPWLIEPKNIQQLIHSPDGTFHISMSQLMQAVVIMTHVYSLSTFIFGCGITAELDHPTAIQWSNSIDGYYHRRSESLNDLDISISSDNLNSSHRSNTNSMSDNEEDRSEESQVWIDLKSSLTTFIDDCPIEVIMERLKEAQEEDDELAEDDVEKMFQTVEQENETIIKNSIHPPKVNPLIERFIENHNFNYINFNSKDFQILRIQEYSWSDEAICLADRFYPDMGRTLEEKFNCSYELTYNTMGDKVNIDTTLFRLSVWIYIHSLYGIRHDDFNYTQLDNLLTKPLKLYLKKSMTKPCTVSKSDFQRFLPEIKFSEKVHIALMAADARQQACLLHVLHAMRFQNN